MDTYHVLREFGASWWLIAMFGFFLWMVLRALKPSQAAACEEARTMLFRGDDAAPVTSQPDNQEEGQNV